MSLWTLILREMQKRCLNVAVAVLAVTIGAASVVAAVSLLRGFDARTEELVAAKQAAVEVQMQAMEDEVRKITKRMGFNILILPKDQNLADFYADNFAAKTMPEAYAHTLAKARGIVTIRHLLPMLSQKVVWPEQKRRILLIGVQGEMPWAHLNNKKPILKPVPPGSVAVGYELHTSLGLKKGQAITILGQSFRVHALHPERGTIDDITLWIDLKTAQILLHEEGRINSMLALECQCAWADLAKVRREVAQVLPNTQVIELAGKALGRAEARQEATKNARLVVTREQEHRKALRQERAGQMAILVPLVVAACGLLVGVLAFLNVRQRRIEIGTLRALGLRTAQILFAFLGKALILGAAGSVLGCIVGLGVARHVAESAVAKAASGWAGNQVLLASVLVATPLVSMFASWIPALAAALQDPAEILREE